MSVVGPAATASLAFFRYSALVSVEMLTGTASFSHASDMTAESLEAFGNSIVKSSCISDAWGLTLTRSASFSAL